MTNKENRLNGTNKLCAGCLKKCKQFKQVTVIRCPNYAENPKLHLDPEQNSSNLG